MTTPVVVAADATVRVCVDTPIVHLCPFVDEVDIGEAEISWMVSGETIELHSLWKYLADFADARIGHEELVDRIVADLSTLSPRITDVRARLTFTTAGFKVEVANAVLRKPVDAASP
jgi:NADPH-dependent 7-cyano-7-deazaguanine reductase QueF